MRLHLSGLRQFLFALGLIAAALALRMPFFRQTVWNLDEGSTFTMAEIVRHGGVLYRDAADNRTPLVPYAKALIFAVVGDWNARGVHIAVALMIGLTAVLLWRLARRLGDTRAGAAGAIFFTLLSFVMLATADPMATHTGWFLIFFSAIGYWAFAWAQAARRTWLALIAGLAFGLASMAKQPGLLDLIVVLVLCALTALRDPGHRTQSLRLAGFLLGGFAAILTGTAAYFYLHGAWHDFIYYTWTYNTKLYVPEVPLSQRLAMVRAPFALASRRAPFALGLGIVAAIWLLVKVSRSWLRRSPLPVFEWLVLGWSASGLVSTMLSGRTFTHYSIQVLPGLSLACGWACARLGEYAVDRWKNRQFWGTLAVGLMLTAGFASLGTMMVRQLRSYAPTDGTTKEWGEFIEANTTPRDRIFVWGYMPELHLFSHRLPNTRFVYSVFLTGLIPWTNLDPLKDTDYAIVPGAWDAFWADFERQRPAFIIDTGYARGFLKYPLKRQKKLWSIIEREYVEVTPAGLPFVGVRLFKRAVAPVPPQPTEVPSIDPKLIPESKPRQVGQDAQISLGVPEGVRTVTLWLDGRPYQQVELPARRAVRCNFLLPAPEVSEGEHVAFVVAQSSDGLHKSADLTIAAATPAPANAIGPALVFDGRSIPPVESETAGGEPRWQEETQWWLTNAPSRIVYVRPPEMEWMDFSFGLSPYAYNGSQHTNTDGVDVVVIFEDTAGKQTILYRRSLNPVAFGYDQGTQSGTVKLPDNAPGRIILLITAGPNSDPTCDWSYWKSVSGEYAPLHLVFRGKPVRPQTHETAFGQSVIDFHAKQVVLVHTPSRFVFRLQPGMYYLTGSLGLLDSAWNKDKKTRGVGFAITHIADDGTRKVLYTRTLEPATVAPDRGVQHFSVQLPLNGRLELSTAAAHDNDNSYGYAFWHELVVGDFPATISYDGREITALNATGTFGFTYIDEQGANVLFAHPSSQIVYSLPPDASRLEGVIGLLRRAYTDTNNTDGATFIVEFEAENGTRSEIFRRSLNPRDIPADRGNIPFAVNLPPGPSRHLILRTEPPPSKNSAFAWSYWYDLRLVPSKSIFK